MHPDLIAFASGALDEPARSRLEAQLRTDAALRRELTQVRRQLGPLLEADAVAPPPGLVMDTLALVAEHACRDLPKAPSETRAGSMADRPWWRRADALVAASIALTLVALLLPALFALRVSSLQTACSNNLRSIWDGLNAYESAHHSLPDVTLVPRPAAGMVAPILREAGYLPANVGCPVDGPVCLNVPMHDLVNLPKSEFERAAVRLLPGYAYSLGFRDDAGALRGPALSHPDVPAAQLPLLADAPNLAAALGNSPNHAGRGQNVLFSDGHVDFKTVRTAGLPGDDIYLNQAHRVAAGLGLHDVVLGAGAAVP